MQEIGQLPTVLGTICPMTTEEKERNGIFWVVLTACAKGGKVEQTTGSRSAIVAPQHAPSHFGVNKSTLPTRMTIVTSFLVCVCSTQQLNTILTSRRMSFVSSNHQLKPLFLTSDTLSRHFHVSPTVNRGAQSNTPSSPSSAPSHVLCPRRGAEPSAKVPSPRHDHRPERSDT